MRKNPASEVYDIPQYTYFEFGNTFTGSYGKLSYKIIPGENFTVQIWHSRLCSELADIEADLYQTGERHCITGTGCTSQRVGTGNRQSSHASDRNESAGKR